MAFTTIAAEPVAATAMGRLVRSGAAGRRGARAIEPAARTVVLVYATCAGLALAYPQALAAWLDDFEPNPAIELAQGGVARLTALSEALGLAPASGSLREIAKRVTRKPE